MELSLFHMGSIDGLTAEQRTEAEKFINQQIYGVVGTNNPKTGARLSCLNNMPGQTLDKLYFATDSGSAKIANIWADPLLEVLYTDGNSQLFLAGKASIVEDKALKQEKWIDFMYNHFKDGPDGEQYCLVEFRPTEARIMLAALPEFEHTRLEPVHIMGISIRTSNAAQQSTNDIGNLWCRFFQEGILEKIPNKTGNDIYGVYTEYENGAKGGYTLIIGCPVAHLDRIPEGLKGVTIEGGNFARTHVSGKLSDGVIEQGWMSVWQSNLDRRYQADFEHYTGNGFDPDCLEVDIFVGVN